MTVLAPDIQIADTLHALADSNRLKIISLLSSRDHCVCHLVESLNLKQSIVSHHIGVLRRANLVTNYPHSTDRRWLYYRLNREQLAVISSHLLKLTNEANYNPIPLSCPIDESPSEQ